MTLVHRSLAHLAETIGDEEARKIHLAAEESVRHVTETIEKQALPCDAPPNGLITVSNSEPQDAAIRREVETAGRLGLGSRFEFLDTAAARERIFRRMRESFEWFFPQLARVPFEHTWGGPIAVTGNFMPHVGWFGRERHRVAYAYGYNGHGVAISNLAAHVVSDLFAGRKTEWTDLWFVGRKPTGLGPRWLRNPLVRAAVKSQIRADDEGHKMRDPWIVRALNRLLSLI